jgi:hypothetical protein
MTLTKKEYYALEYALMQGVHNAQYDNEIDIEKTLLELKDKLLILSNVVRRTPQYE